MKQGNPALQNEAMSTGQGEGRECEFAGGWWLVRFGLGDEKEPLSR